jgi:hypothetical protein
MTALRAMKTTIRKNLNSFNTWNAKKFGPNPRFCKFYPRQIMWCKPFLSPPKMCRCFAKQIVMWATFQSIGLQGCKKPVSSPTFGASSLNQRKAGLGHTCEQYFVQFLENPQTQMRGEDGVRLDSYLYVESGPSFITLFCGQLLRNCISVLVSDVAYSP